MLRAVVLEHANLADSELLHLFCEAVVVLAELSVRMGVRRGGETDSFFDREPDNFVGGIEFVDRFAPAGRGELDCQAARGDEIEGLGNKVANRRLRTMPVDLDEVEMRQAIDQPGRGDLADAAKVIGVNVVDVAPGELLGAIGDLVEHLVAAFEVMDGAENEIEAVQVLLDPGATGRRSFRIVVELEAGPDFYVWIRCAQFVDLVEIDSRVITIVIGKGDVAQASRPGAVDPGLEQCLGERLDAVDLGMGVVIGKQLRVNS